MGVSAYAVSAWRLGVSAQAELREALQAIPAQAGPMCAYAVATPLVLFLSYECQKTQIFYLFDPILRFGFNLKHFKMYNLTNKAETGYTCGTTNSKPLGLTIVTNQKY